MSHLPTRCCVCQHSFSIRPSISMQMGINSGHVSCPACGEFLHVEALECEAWNERWADYLQRETHGPSIVAQHRLTKPRNDHDPVD